MAERHDLGVAGEEVAAGWLQRAGFQILARNYRCASGEVDIVATEQGEVVFVEVRTRRTGALVGPAESVTWRKQQRILRAAERYLQVHALGERPWRVDVVAVEVDRAGRVQQVEHLRSVIG
jgi:putative endonuclease